MGLLSSDDLVQMQGDLTAVVSDRSESIVIRRGDSTLGARTVRIARSGGRGAAKDSEGAEEKRGGVIVIGDTTFDVEPNDRFNDSNGVLYRVVLVRPNRSFSVQAEVEVIE